MNTYDMEHKEEQRAPSFFNWEALGNVFQLFGFVALLAYVAHDQALLHNARFWFWVAVGLVVGVGLVRMAFYYGKKACKAFITGLKSVWHGLVNTDWPQAIKGGALALVKAFSRLSWVDWAILLAPFALFALASLGF